MFYHHIEEDQQQVKYVTLSGTLIDVTYRSLKNELWVL